MHEDYTITYACKRVREICPQRVGKPSLQLLRVLELWAGKWGGRKKRQKVGEEK